MSCLFLALMPKPLAFEFVSFKTNLNASCQQKRRQEDISKFWNLRLKEKSRKMEEKENINKSHTTLSLKWWKNRFPFLASCVKGKCDLNRDSQDIVVFIVKNLFMVKHFHLAQRLSKLQNFVVSFGYRNSDNLP